MIPYFGSKKRLAKWIDLYLPKERSNLTLVEPYCGSASVSLNVSPFSHLVLNDLYFPVVNFHQHVKDKPEALIDYIRDIKPYYNLDVPSYAPTLLAAAEFYLYSKLSFSGGGTRWNTGEVKRNIRFNYDLIRQTSQRLRASNTSITCLRALDIIDLYDLPDVVLYSDPTYQNFTRGTKDNRVKNQAASLTRKQYAIEMSDRDHEIMLHRLKRFSGRCIVSGFDSPLYDSILVGWNKQIKPTRTTSSNSIEVIWISPS